MSFFEYFDEEFWVFHFCQDLKHILSVECLLAVHSHEAPVVLSFSVTHCFTCHIVLCMLLPLM